MMTELKPCPFCGNTDLEIHVEVCGSYVAIECGNCGGRMDHTRMYANCNDSSTSQKLNAVMEDWNRRGIE